MQKLLKTFSLFSCYGEFGHFFLSFHLIKVFIFSWKGCRSHMLGHFQRILNTKSTRKPQTAVIIIYYCPYSLDAAQKW